ncbi:MAG: hypothetical protein IT305_15835 [Chloroflexi bacterium]|nr:hypothetical protein [Chloroflexota bacterium]
MVDLAPPDLRASSAPERSAGGEGRPRTLFLCIPSGTPAANLLRTDVFRLLRESPLVGRIVVLSPLVRDARFREEFAGEKVAFAALEPHEPGWLERRIIRVLQEKYVKTMPTESMRIRVARERRLELREVRYLDRGGLGQPATKAVRVALAAITRLPLSLPLLFKAIDLTTLGRRYAALFRRERPDLLVTPTTGIYFAEGPLMGRADAEGVPILAVDLSWDHFTTKTAPLRRVAGLAVWNETMKRQAVEIHGYHPGQVCVAGVPQFDLYARADTHLSREQFFKRIGADPTKKLVTLTTIPPVLYTYHDVAIDEILGAIRTGRFGTPAQLLVRVHPRDDLTRYERFVGQPDVIVEKPFRETLVAEGSNVDPSLENRRHLANTLKHSDVIVNVASTIAIEAAIADTPVVNVAFDGYDEREFLNSARRYYQYTHYKPLVDAGAVRVAATPCAMLDEIHAYLADPARDREGRRRAVEEQCARVDGHSAERVAGFVLDQLARVR